MRSDPELWYVRDGNTISGPFTYGELDASRRRGELQWFHEVSHDQVIWVSASTLKQSPTDPSSEPARAWSVIGSSRGRGKPTGAVPFVGGAVTLAGVLGLVWLYQNGALGLSGKANSTEAVRRVLQADDLASKETVHAVGARETPSTYARAIGEYLALMHEVDMTDCPADFRIAFKHHLESWAELGEAVRALPEGFLEGFFVGALNGLLRGENDGGVTRMADEIKRASGAVSATFREVERIAAQYDVVPP